MKQVPPSGLSKEKIHYVGLLMEIRDNIGPQVIH